jgi:hypothetical protein
MKFSVFNFQFPLVQVVPNRKDPLINTVALARWMDAFLTSELFQQFVTRSRKPLKPGFCDRENFEHKTRHRILQFLMQRNRKLTSQPAEMQALETCKKGVSIPNAKSGLKRLKTQQAWRSPN